MRQLCRYFLLISLLLASAVLSAHNTGFTEFEFIKNQGQWHKNIEYKVQLPEGNIYIEQGRLKFHLADMSVVSQIHIGDYKGDWKDAMIKNHVYNANFIGANTNCQIVQEDLQEMYYNYYLGNDKTKWSSGTPASHAVRYKALYPGVDLLIFSHEGGIKYEFHCENYAAAQQIQIEYEGQDDLKLKDGIFTVYTSLGDVSESAPIVFHSSESNNDTLSAKYSLSKNVLTYDLKVEDKNKNLPIVIDPDLIFSTYSGSTTTNFGFTATYDSEGFLYSGSLIFGTGYPTTTGAFDQSFNGGSRVFGLPGCDVAVTKYDTSGTKAIFSTYLGGSGDEMPHSIVVNSRDELYVYGTTGSQNFPTTGAAYQDTLTNPNAANSRTLEVAVGYLLGCDMFISAFQPDGRQLLASTYVGGSENDGINNPSPFGFGNPRVLNYNYADVARGEIDIDKDDNIYIVGSTRSTDFPIKGNPIYPTYRGGTQDGIIVKFKPLLDTLIWSSYFGGAFSDAIYSLAFRKNGNITIAGGTTSSILFPSGSLTGFTTFQGGRADGFVAEIRQDGQAVVASTYFGSREYDQIYFVERDRYDNVYVFGQTEDASSRLVQNAQYAEPTAGQFITKFTPAIDSIIWSTKFGTPVTSGNARPNISPTAFLVDLCNSVYLSGWGGTTNAGNGNNSTIVTGMDTTRDAFQPTTTGSDLYLMVLADDASRLIYGSFFGGSSAAEHVDGGTSRFDRKGKIYQAVCAGCPTASQPNGSSDFPTKPNPGAVSNLNRASGGCNNAIFKMDFLLPAVVAEFQLPRTICTNDSIQLRNLSLEQKSTNYKWFFGNGDSSELKTPKVNYDSVGTYEILLIVSDSTSCNLNDSITKKVTLIDPVSSTLPNDSICIGESIVLGKSNPSEFSYNWTPGNLLDDSTKINPSTSPTAPTQFILLIDNGICIDTNYQFIQVDSFIRADFLIPDSICTPDTISLANRSNVLVETAIRWDLAGGSSDTVLSPNYTIIKPGFYEFLLVLTDSNSCNQADSIRKTIEAKSDTTFKLKDILICNNSALPIGLPPDTNYVYNWSTSLGISDSTVSDPLGRTLVDTTLKLFINKGVCTDTALQLLQADSIRISTHSDTVICSNVPSLVLDGKHFGTGTLYQWSSNNTFDDQLNTSILDSTARVFYGSLFENTYYMRSVSSRGCNAFDSTKVFVNDFGIRVSDSISLCLNDTTTLSVVSLIENDTLNVLWTPFKDIYGPNDTSSIKVNPSESRTYFVDVQTAFNCRASREVYVFVSDMDSSTALLTGSRDTIVKVLNSELNAEPKGYSYFWSPTKGLSDPRSDNPFAKPDTTTTYTVTIVDPEVPQCTVQRNFKVFVEELFCEPPYVFLPNTFTPNGDGKNDELQLYGKYIDEMNLQIFNRWGELVFEANDPSETWDGSYKGNENWPEVFVYQLYVKCIDGQEYKNKGDITIVK